MLTCARCGLGFRAAAPKPVARGRRAVVTDDPTVLASRDGDALVVSLPASRGMGIGVLFLAVMMTAGLIGLATLERMWAHSTMVGVWAVMAVLTLLLWYVGLAFLIGTAMLRLDRTSLTVAHRPLPLRRRSVPFDRIEAFAAARQRLQSSEVPVVVVVRRDRSNPQEITVTHDDDQGIALATTLNEHLERLSG